MRLASIQTPAGPRAVLQKGDHFIDLHATDASLPIGARELLEGGPDALAAAAKVLTHPHPVTHAAARATFLPPIMDPQKIICVGLNYRDHAIESGAAIPRDPVLFSKYATALVGHEARIVLPSVSKEVDYEAELVVVIGKKCRHVKAAEAMGTVAGYTVGHDVSARDWQLQKDGKQWMAGKTFDTFAPVGPFLVTADEVPDPGKLGIRLRLNGKTLQDSNTCQLIFTIGEIIAYLTTIMTLMPGDLIFTGTPPGVGMARKPPIYLQAGDVCEVEIDGLGVLRNPVVAE